LSRLGKIAAPPDGEQLLDLVAGGDRPARRALLDAGRLIGRTIARRRWPRR